MLKENAVKERERDSVRCEARLNKWCNFFDMKSEVKMKPKKETFNYYCISPWEWSSSIRPTHTQVKQ